MRRGLSRRRGGRTGFTLVELLVAMTILSIALLPLAGTMLSLVRLQTAAGRRLEMTNLASDKLSEVEALALAGTPPAIGGSLTTSTTGFADPLNPPLLGPSGMSYIRRWLVTSGPVTGTFIVSVRVVPLGDMGRTPLEVTLGTMVDVP